MEYLLTRTLSMLALVFLVCACGVAAEAPATSTVVVSSPAKKDTGSTDTVVELPPDNRIDLSSPNEVVIERYRCEADLAALRISHGAAHPDVAEAQARIDALKERVDELESRGQLADPSRVVVGIDALLAEVKVELATLKVKYGPSHPKIVAEQAKADSLETILASVHNTSAQ